MSGISDWRSNVTVIYAPRLSSIGSAGDAEPLATRPNNGPQKGADNNLLWRKKSITNPEVNPAYRKTMIESPSRRVQLQTRSERLVSSLRARGAAIGWGGLAHWKRSWEKSGFFG